MLFVIGSLLPFTNASAQYNTMRMNYGGCSRSDYAFTAGVVVDAPLHNLNEAYKASPGFEAGLLRHFGNFIIGLHGGYRAFKPKQSAFQDYDEQTGQVYGTSHLSKYTSIAIYTSAVYQLGLGSGANLQAGLNLGNYFSHFSIDYADTFQGGYGSYTDYGNFNLTESQFYIAPRIGINFTLTEDVQLGLQARYNVFGNYSYNYNTIDGGESSGTVYTSVAGGVSLIYRFP